MQVRRARAIVMTGIAVTLAAAAGTAAGGSAPNAAVAPEADVAQVLLAVTNEYNAVWETLDPKKIEEYHAEDFTYYREGKVAAASPQEFGRMFHDEVATQITAYRADTSDAVVKVMSPDSGMVAFLFRGEVTTPDGATHEYSGGLTYVLQRRGGEWKIAHIHESLLPHIGG